MERMRRLDRPVVLTILFAILVTALAGTLHQLATISGCVELVVASSQEKAMLMQKAAVDFKANRPVVGGRCVDVTVEAIASGAAEQALVDGWKRQVIPRPDVWSPAATTWLALLDEHRMESKLASLFVPGTPNSLMQSPLVIAMPEPMAKGAWLAESEDQLEVGLRARPGAPRLGFEGVPAVGGVPAGQDQS
jgi:hypothetical protein